MALLCELLYIEKRLSQNETFMSYISFYDNLLLIFIT